MDWIVTDRGRAGDLKMCSMSGNTASSLLIVRRDTSDLELDAVIIAFLVGTKLE